MGKIEEKWGVCPRTPFPTHIPSARLYQYQGLCTRAPPREFNIYGMEWENGSPLIDTERKGLLFPSYGARFLRGAPTPFTDSSQPSAFGLLSIAILLFNISLQKLLLILDAFTLRINQRLASLFCELILNKILGQLFLEPRGRKTATTPKPTSPLPAYISPDSSPLPSSIL